MSPFASASSSSESFYSQSDSVDTQFLGSLRAKLGMAFGDFFPYVTAGIALGHYKVRAQSELKLSSATVKTGGTGVSLVSSKTFKETAIGGVVGGGLSTVAFQNVIVSVEGLYYVFNDKVDVSSGFLNTIGDNTVAFDNVIEGRFKVSIPFN